MGLLGTDSVQTSLRGRRVLAALNGLEVFGHERANIEVFKLLRKLGAEVCIGVNSRKNGGAVGLYLRKLGFETFTLPFSNQWSKMWLKQDPGMVFEKFAALTNCSRIFKRQIDDWRPTHVHLGSALVFSYLAPALYRSSIPLGKC